MNHFVRFGRPAAIGAALMSAVTLALAELPAGVGTGITASQTDGTALIGLLAAAGAAVFIIAKILRRFGVFL